MNDEKLKFGSLIRRHSNYEDELRAISEKILDKFGCSEMIIYDIEHMTDQYWDIDSHNNSVYWNSVKDIDEEPEYNQPVVGRMGDISVWHSDGYTLVRSNSETFTDDTLLLFDDEKRTTHWEVDEL